MGTILPGDLGGADPQGTPSPTLSTASLPMTTTSQTATVSMSPSPSHSKDQKSEGIPAGALAGAIIGTAVLTALITFAISFLVMRKRLYKSRRRSQLSLGKIISDSSDDSRRDPYTQFNRYLPQSADDQSVRQAVLTLLTQADQHVSNFYQDAPTIDMGRQSQEEQQAMQSLQSDFLPDELSNMIENSRHPTALIKHALANLILDPDNVLPPAFTSLPHSIYRFHEHPESVKGFPMLFSHWRVLTGHLHPPLAKDPDARAFCQAASAAAARTFSTAFSPWATDLAGAERHAHLLSLFESATEVAVLLFQQPSNMAFDWHQQPKRVGGMAAMFPALAKTTDPVGTPLAKPQTLVEAVPFPYH